MSTRLAVTITVSVVALFLLVAAALVWPQMQPRGLVLPESKGSAHDAVPRTGHQDPGPAANRGLVEKTTAAANPAKPEPVNSGFDLAQLKEGEVLIRARVKLDCPHGLDILRILNGTPWTLALRFEGTDSEVLDFCWSGDDRGKIEVAEPAETLPLDDKGVSTGKWSACVTAAGAEGFSPIAAPKLEGRVLDFGTIDLAFNPDLGESGYIVIGRLVHASGVAVVPMEDVAMRVGPPEADRNALDCQADGSFGFHHTDRFNGDFSGLIFMRENEEYADPIMKLQAPKPHGRVLDFGDIMLDCAAIEVSASGWPDDASRMARLGITDPSLLEPMSLRVSLFNYGNLDHSARVSRGESVRMFMTAGPYRWAASMSDAAMVFGELTGTLQLEAGKLARLEIELKPVPSVLVRIRASRPVTEVQLVASVKEESTIFNNNVIPANGPVAIPNPGHKPLRITVAHRLFKAVCKEIPGDATECTLELTELSVPVGTLVVVYPALPTELQQRDFSANIVLTQTVNGVVQTRNLGSIGKGDWRWGFENRDALPAVDLECGPISLDLQEGKWGYPGNHMSGPVSALIESSQTTYVNMPAPAVPSWEVPSGTIRCFTTCDGKPIDYFGPVSVSGEPRSLTLNYNHGHNYPHGEYAVIDGDTRIPLTMEAPTEGYRAAVIKHDFPARIRVRITRGKQDLPGPIQVRAEGEKKQWRCAASGEGSVSLWLPRGKAHVQASAYGLPALGREIEVTDNCAEIVFELEGSVAHFEWDEYADRDGSAWLLLDARGAVVAALAAGIKMLKLEPGSYSAQPLAPGQRALEFEIQKDVDLRVHMPFVAAVDLGGTILVPYPKDCKPDADGYMLDVRWTPSLSGDVKRDLRYTDYYDGIGWRFTNEGIVFHRVPLDAEFVIAMGLRPENERGPLGWAVAPTKLKLSGNQKQTVKLEWKQGVVLRGLWNINGLSWETPDFQYPSEWQVFVPGQYTLRLELEGGSNTFDLTLAVVEGKFYEMPEAVRKLIFGEEEPDSGESGGD